MSQGWGQGPQGGVPQQGGYGPPPGQGYGPPPGQGYTPPPGQGHTPPPGQGGGGASGGFGRFVPGIILGGVLSGVLSMIPLLNLLNCCFCLLNVGGVLGGLAMHMNRAPNDKVSMGEAAGFGAAAGAIGGVMMVLGSMLMNLALGALLADLYRSISPDLARQMQASAAMSILALPIYAVLFGGFGALGGVVGISVFWKDRQPGKS